MSNSQHDKSGARARSRHRRHVAAAALLAACAWMMATNSADAATAAYPQIFGSSELHSDNLTRFTKWTSVIRRADKEFERCQATGCTEEGWRDFIASVGQRDIINQLRAVNSRINRTHYVADEDGRGTPDYWATPLEFLRDGGDCEDYAIAKYIALRQLGVPAADMRLVVLQHLQRGMPHAVLVVYAEGRPYVLDNLLTGVQLADNSLPYRPVYSVNETGWWLHISPKNNKPNWTQTALADDRTDAGTAPDQRRNTLK